MKQIGTLEQLCDYVNELRSFIADLVGVNKNMLDRIERLEDEFNIPHAQEKPFP